MTAFIINLIILCMAGLIYILKHHPAGHSGRGQHSHDGAVFSVDVLAYNSKINSWNPGFKVGFSVLLLLICVLSEDPGVSLLVILVTGFVTVVLGGVHLGDYLRFLKVPIIFLILGSVAILFNFSSEAAGIWALNCHFFYLYISAQSLQTTIMLWGKAFGAVSAMYMMSLSTPSTEIFSVLRRLHLPKLFIELMNMIYRYIFILMDTQMRMKNAAQSRLGYCDFKTAVTTFGQSMGNLLVVSMKKSGSYFDAMEARCYDGDLLFLEAEKPLQQTQLFMAGIFILMLVTVWIF